MDTLKKLFLFALFLAAPLGVLAQSGKITGQVVDVDGEPLIGATVGIQGTTKGSIVDVDGNYLMLNVAPGTYVLEARYIGYATGVVQEVIVRTDLTTNQDFVLSLESFEGEEIVVTAARKTIIKDITSSESRVSSAEIEKLPVQEVTDIIQLQAGVNVDNGGGIHIRGGRTSEVSYVVDGIRVTDDYDRSNGVRIENESVQELQVISGSFNAEHGQALSGIVNVVTKSGGNDFEGSVSGWAGGYMATNKSYLYDGIGTSLSSFNPTRMTNLSASLSGPIIKDKLTFFATARRFENKGYLTGRNAYSPHGAYQDTLSLGSDLAAYRTIYNEQVDLNKPWYSIDTVVIAGNQKLLIRDNGKRDSARVDMSAYESQSFQGNLEFKLSKGFKLNAIGTVGNEEGGGYDHQNKFVPFGRSTSFRNNYSLNLKATITPSNTTFITLNAANRYNEQKNYLYENPWDPRYFNSENISKYGLDIPGNGQFSTYGNDTGRFERSTNTYIIKGEISSQLNEHHYIKAGVNVQLDEVNFESISLIPLSGGSDISLPPNTPTELIPFVELGYPEVNTPGYQKYSESPRNFSAYIQDKIEYDQLIINVGLRFDYFDPNALIPADLEDPDIYFPTKQENQYRDTNKNGQQDVGESSLTLEDREGYWWKEASAKYQISPRLGVAYPINDNGVIYFSYGYFFQIPSYNLLYTNSQILLAQSGGSQGLFGNPDLKPERSTQYELGLKQEIAEGTSIEITGYYKDTRDYVSSRPQVTGASSITYGLYFNRDYSKSIGLTFAFNQFVSRQFNFGLDYTYGRVEGSNSDPNAEFFAIIGQGGKIDSTNQESALTKLEQPLDWDRQHIINGSMFYTGNKWGANLLTRFSSGTPYTPASDIPGVLVGEVASTRDLRNTSRLPTRFTIDLNAYKDFDLPGNSNLQVYFNVYNLLDTKVVNGVYSDSGNPNSPLPVNISPSTDNGYYSNPGMYAEPRRIQFGVQLSF
tara:strand:- start:1611 stop:4556 length:2946 start_codon:yes stop_codon:yes gene_type:complete